MSDITDRLDKLEAQYNRLNARVNKMAESFKEWDDNKGSYVSNVSEAQETADAAQETADTALERTHLTYSNTTRPSATLLQAGTQIFNTDDNAPNWTDGTNWRDADGNIT